MASDAAPNISSRAASEALDQLPMVVIDFETTGLYPSQGDRIVEVGAMWVDGLTVRPDATFLSLVNPERPVSPPAFRVHGIPDSLLATQPLIEQVLPNFMGFLGERVLVGQNIAFDLSFLNRALRDCRLPPPGRQVLDTRWLSQLLQPNERHHSLDAIASRLGLQRPPDRHRALGDVQLTAEILVRQLTICLERGMRTFEDVLSAHDRLEGGPHGDVHIRHVLEHCFRERRAVQLVYGGSRQETGRGQPEEMRQVDIYHFAPPYFWAYCHTRKAIRTFRVDRVAKAAPLENTYEVPSDFHPQDHFIR